MKKKDWITLLLIILCAAVLVGYRAVSRIRKDVTAPVISVTEGIQEFSILDPRSTLLQGVSAQDKADGDVTASLVVESVRLLNADGTATVTYAAFDKAGNVAKCQREVRFHDYESPRFSLTAPLLFSHTSSYNVLNIIKAEDMLDGNISHRIRATVLDEVSSGHSGTHNVQFRVTNSLGEMVELVLPVELYTPSPFEGSMTLTNYLIYLKEGDHFDKEAYLGRFYVGRDEISLRGELPEGMTLDITGTVKTAVPGVYTVDYEVNYDQNGQIYTAYSRLIVVVEE